MQINLDTLYTNEHNFLTNAINTQYSKGKSIVTTCYDSALPTTWVLLNELKRLNCNLPIEIFYRKGELSQFQIKLLLSINLDQLTLNEIQGTPKDFISKYGHKHGWACKIYALFESKYAENLWIDNDNFPIIDPAFLFDDQEYIDKGVLLWREMISTDSANQYADNSPMWPIFNVPINDAEAIEAGQLLINKNKCPTEFNLLKFYADNCEIYYHFGGDKETFKLAWQRIAYINQIPFYRVNYHSDPNVTFALMPFGPFSKGSSNQYHKWGGGTVMVHRDRNGLELFNHRNMQKMQLTNNPFYADITNEAFYHDHIKELNKLIRS